MQASAVRNCGSEKKAMHNGPREISIEAMNSSVYSTESRLYAGLSSEMTYGEEQVCAPFSLLQLCRHPLQQSSWSHSAGKRFFDCSCVLLALPLVLPLAAVTALLVRLTSRGPVLFVQNRVGLHGRIFRIFKFRSMEHLHNKTRKAVTTASNQKFTPVGPFLRRFKLDELPQLFNVLNGEMSLVGPRPKMQEHVKHDLSFRPGITGYATLTFAREEMAFSRLPKEEVESFYHKVVLPTKRRLDESYMANATFLSDLMLIFKTILRRWDATYINQLVDEHLNQSEINVVTPARKTVIPVSISSSRHGMHFSTTTEEVGTL